MANQDEFFKLHGAKELSDELRKLSRGGMNKILRPGMRQGAAEIRKAAKRMVPVDKGNLKKALKSKVFTAKKGAKGVVASLMRATASHPTARSRSHWSARSSSIKRRSLPLRGSEAIA